MNKRFLIALLLAVFFGLAAIFVARSLLSNQQKQAVEQGKVPVIVAVAPIPRGTAITEQQVVEAKYPIENLPEGVMTKKKEVVGRVALVDISVKLPIIKTSLAAPDSPIGLQGVLGPEERAVSVRVDEASNVAGFTQPGTHVDVIAIMQPQANDSKPVSKVILQDIRVLASGQKMETNSDGKAAAVNTVTLQVTPAQVEILKLAESEGKLQLAMRNPTDTINQRTKGATRHDVLNDPALEARARVPNAGTAKSPPPPIVMPTATTSPTPPPCPLVARIELLEGAKRSQTEFRQCK